MTRERLPLIENDDIWTVPKHKLTYMPPQKVTIDTADGVRSLVSTRLPVFFPGIRLPRMTEVQKKLVRAIRTHDGHEPHFERSEEWNKRYFDIKDWADEGYQGARKLGEQALRACEDDMIADYDEQLEELNALVPEGNGIWVAFEPNYDHWERRVYGLGRLAGFGYAEFYDDRISPIVTGRSGRPGSVPLQLYMPAPYVEAA